jgi:hypothetical protein
MSGVIFERIKHRASLVATAKKARKVGVKGGVRGALQSSLKRGIRTAKNIGVTKESHSHVAHKRSFLPGLGLKKFPIIRLGNNKRGRCNNASFLLELRKILGGRLAACRKGAGSISTGKPGRL